MPVYFGFPVTCDEAARILNIDIDVTAASEQRLPWYYRGLNQITAHLKKQSTGIEAHVTSKGQLILGYHLEEMEDVWNFSSLMTAGALITRLQQLQADFSDEMNALGADLRRVHVYPMEGELVTVDAPQPYVLHWKYD